LTDNGDIVTHLPPFSVRVNDTPWKKVAQCVAYSARRSSTFAESRPGSIGRLLLDNYDTTLKTDIKDHNNGEMNEDVYTEA
jgi:hypothetical protein